MKVTAVIAEYNPFHLGHLMQLTKARQETGCDFLVVIMSGSFTERGDFTVLPRRERALHAVAGGADLVLELPSVYAVSPAENFAGGAIRTLSCFPDLTLSFGSESGDISQLKEIAKILDSEPPELSRLLKENLKTGKNYARSRGEAFALLYPHLSEALNKPNNILAIEYIRAASKHPNIRLHTVKREDNFNKTEIAGEYASAAAIRELIKDGEDFSAYVPEFVKIEKPDFSHVEKALLENMRDKPKDELSKIAEVKEGLENRIKKYVGAKDFEEFLHAVKTKRYTMARIKRIAVSAYLGITQDLTAAAKQSAPYASVLALNESRAEDIKLLLESYFDFIVFPGAGILPHFGDNVSNMMFKIDNKAEKVYNR